MGSETSILVAAGVVALVAAVVWRQAARHSRKAGLIRRFASPMPERRAKAGAELVELGLSRCAKPILAHVADEDDPEVRRVIALAIAQRQWEPGGSARVNELRSWARAELERQGYDVTPLGPAFTRLSDMGGPRLPARDDATVEATEVATEETEDTPDSPDKLHWKPQAPVEPAVEQAVEQAVPDATTVAVPSQP